MNTWMLVIMGIHLLVCLLCAILTGLRVLKNSYIDVFLLMFIPVFGLVSLLLRSHVYRKRERTARELELSKLHIHDEVQRSILLDHGGATDEVVPLSEALLVNDAGTQRIMMKEALYDLHSSIRVDEDPVQEQVVPLQEALLLNDSRTRRELIMDVLYTNPSGFVPQLSDARENDDAEVVHYAATALAELQKEYDQQFQAVSQELMEHPDDEVVLRRYQGILERYLSSGLLEGARRETQLQKYVEVLKKRLQNNQESLSLWIKKADADMLLGNWEALRGDAEKMISFRRENEQGYLYLLKYYALGRDAEGVKEVTQMLAGRGIYLSPKGRSELEFWC